jgi:diguanylate cyclase (GGDEF)-like protein
VNLDIATLFVVNVFILALGGLLLIFAWLQNRKTRALAWWGTAYLVMAPATALFALRGEISDFWSIEISNALFALGYGVLWSGARVFEGRTPKLPWAAAGAVVWLLACRFDGFLASLWARIVLGSLLLCTYSFLVVLELWRGRHDGLISRWPTMAVLGFHGSLFAFRIVFATSLPFPLGTLPQAQNAAALLTFSFLFHSFAVAFLLLALAKERAELNYKLASLTDALTGIPNRRGFNERAERLIARCKVDQAPLTLLLCDLDNFKTINDRFGHLTGDELLVAFANSLTLSLRPLDLVGRIGGEEFVALLPGIPSTAIMVTAERVRAAFERAGHNIAGRQVQGTVSIGTASTALAEYSFASLYAMADEALYRAKQKGRNRIELGYPALSMVPGTAASTAASARPTRSTIA